MNDKVRYWKCPNCGQVHFGDEPPDLCDFCQDFTTWRLISGTRPNKTPAPPVESRDDDHPAINTQLPLFPGD